MQHLMHSHFLLLDCSILAFYHGFDDRFNSSPLPGKSSKRFTTQMEDNPLGAKFCCCQLTKIFRAPPKQLATSPPEQPESFLLTTTRWRWCPLTTHQNPLVVTECFFRKVLELEMFFFCKTIHSKM